MNRRPFGRVLRPACRAVAVAAALAMAAMTLAEGQPAQQAQAAQASALAPSASAGLDGIKAAVDDIEKSVSGAQTEDEVVVLKRRLAPLREGLRERAAQLELRLKEINQRPVEFETPPTGPGVQAPPIEAERTAADHADVDAALDQAKLLADRVGDLDRRIDDRQRELFANRLLARGASLFDSGFWSDLAEAVAAELRGLAELMALWIDHARRNGGAGGALAAAAILAALGGAARFAARRLRQATAGPTPRRFDKAMTGLIILGADTVMVPVLIAATVLVPRNFGLMPDPIVDIGLGLVAAAFVIGFGRGLAAALFAPGEPARRILAVADRDAERCASHLTAAAGAFGLAVFLNAVHRTLGAPAAPMIATGELLAVAVLGITLHFLWRSAAADAGTDHADTNHAGAAGQALAWLRGILWIAAAALAAALATGYVGFAVFLAGRLLATLAIAGAIAILVVFIDALLTELLAADTPHGRRIAGLFGLSPRGLELAEMLLSAMLRLVLIVLAVLLAIGYSGVLAEDIFGLFQRVTFDHVIGGVSLSPLAILSALAFLVIGGLAVRGAQRWLQTKFLPRTALDAGLQNSISALFGYAALLAVVAFSLAALGIDLQKIALIAGALSVGIGFGLQSVVSNFVCGLILLAERPVRVGDWVVVRNEEGWVRRISVRATEIETFDRASVIIPNQEFITGVVKNWTHGNTMGRIIIKVRVAYDSDLEKVRETLLACAAGHPLVLQTPPPAVYLMGFGDIGIDYELRCLVGNVEQSLRIRSDVQTDIARKFAEAGIKIPYPPHEARPPGPQPAGAASGTG
jgi:potassium-dependent mechanosensitive channel